jgi:hypothetical protein
MDLSRRKLLGFFYLICDSVRLNTVKQTRRLIWGILFLIQNHKNKFMLLLRTEKKTYIYRIGTSRNARVL